MDPAQQRLIPRRFQAIGAADRLKVQPKPRTIIGERFGNALAKFSRRMGKIGPRRRPIPFEAETLAHARTLNRLRAQ